MLALVSLGAFESLAVATAMPTIAAALDGLHLYAPAFAVTLATSVVGMVLAGYFTDRSRPLYTLLGGGGVFVGGLLVAGAAGSMWALLAGRALQGLGAGAYVIALYVMVGEVFSPARRPRVLAMFSAAWVLPSLIGPVIAGVVVEALGWRWVFHGVALLAVPSALLILWAARHGEDRAQAETQSTIHIPSVAAESTVETPSAVEAPRTPRAAMLVRLALAAGAGAGVAVMSVASSTTGPGRAVGLAVGAVVVAVLGLRLLPAGTLTARPGLPALVGVRGLMAAAFFGAEVYLPLILQHERGLSPARAGTILTVGAVTWALGSAARSRSAWSSTAFLRLGSALVATGVVVVAFLTWAPAPTAVAWTGWALAGLGVGMVYPTLSLLVFEIARPGEQGAGMSALQTSDALSTAFALALAGALITPLVARLGSTGYLAGFGLSVALAVVAGLVSGRIQPHASGDDGVSPARATTA
ncbi:Major Facilitator Superfamily protein [Flavimobilis marinus]|uniref:Major Facilitator Superfamily protein n=2 Tax=Flavimobilis marinus TaxID=285351 RepID=A0A1I2DKU4_9MICO|nr:Major Facilitator Superfamily protein [Flavimobilis marinus]